MNNTIITAACLATAALSGVASASNVAITTVKINDATGFNVSLNGVAITLDDFGVTAGQLFSVNDFTITSGANLDPSLVGIASTSLVPEPSTTALLGLGGLFPILRRRN